MIEDLASTADFERRWVRKEPYVQGTPVEGGPFLVHCDDCGRTSGPYRSEELAKIDVVSLGWVTVAHQKFDGVAHSIYCTECKHEATSTNDLARNAGLVPEG